MKVGFIGLGYMGGPMSRNILSAGHDLLVHDIRREAAAGLEVAGAGWAGSPRRSCRSLPRRFAAFSSSGWRRWRASAPGSTPRP